MIINRTLVLKKEGNKFLLPCTKRIEIDAVDNSPLKPYLFCRVVDYYPESGTIVLKLLPDVVNQESFNISKETNSDLLLTLSIKEITLLPHKRINQNIGYTTYDNKTLKSGNKQTPLEDAKSTASQKERLTLHLPVKDLSFSEGKVFFEYYIRAIARKITFEINHSFLKKEHDSIKNYFPKALKITNFSFFLEVEYIDSEVINYSCTSPDISRIDDTIFEFIEELYIQDNIINRSDDTVKSASELVIELSQIKIPENTQDINWLLNKLINKEKTKHYYHLRYLSDKHLSDVLNLSLTGKPLSFIFLLPLKQKYCLVWESYSTDEATYIWKLPLKASPLFKSDIQEHFDLIKHLRQNNKIAFLKTKPKNFKKIEHDYSGDDFGFKKWKTQLDEFLSLDDD